MTLPLQDILAIICGSAVGFSLALIGGGGSILATPLLLYVVGVRDPHMAIGTSALAVAVNAFANVIPHARMGNVRWKPALVFAAAGVVGALLGSSVGKMVNGQHLLVLFALLMLVVAALMIRGRHEGGGDRYPLPHMIPRLGGIGLGTGGLAGFFGIGGGFLIVPGLMLASGMPIINAIGTSLFSVGAFGLTTAINYAASGLVSWQVAVEFIGGGMLGGWLGAKGATHLARKRGALNLVFAGVIVLVAIFMLVKSLRA
ncbi:sulfite exporter TauE/SafE family protein [Dyella silvatica]|uniref:sulfite exporter TauE/SafE family protein n=1 Tax=Dyella silvatica TaxID=2992128 RepID=UPI0022511156|nr:sulfite exporter TauE/SafE family protein [Dyella silvatica]